MSAIDRKARVRDYKENPPPMGVYRVTCTATGNSVIGSSRNAPGRLNRCRFELEFGGGDPVLQREWDELGPGAFVFEVLDTLEPRDEPSYDPGDDLKMLEEMWRERLA